MNRGAQCKMLQQDVVCCTFWGAWLGHTLAEHDPLPRQELPVRLDGFLRTEGKLAQVIKILGADRVIFTDNGIAPSSSEKGVWNAADNPGTLESALQDMALMAHCNDLVMTVASSFGYVAAAWGGYSPVSFCFHFVARL